MSRAIVSQATYSMTAAQTVAAAMPSLYRECAAVAAGMNSLALSQLAAKPLVACKLPEWGDALSVSTQNALKNPATRLAAIDALRAPLKLAETRVATDAVVQSLDAEGFHTRLVLEGQYGFVEARRGHETVLVEVDGTTISRDRAGLDDEACATSDAAFEKQMARRGFRLANTELVEHRNAKGGELIREAGRRNRRNLADGAAQSRRAVTQPGSIARKATEQ